MYCSGGLEILFGNQKEVQVQVPDSSGQVSHATGDLPRMAGLDSYLLQP